MMKKLGILSSAAVVTLSACVNPEGVGGNATSRPLNPVPENVRAIAAPYQDLSDVQINASDGCFVYRHQGPVEATYLPLRNRAGQPICTKRS
ncbi:hypothetical protein SAMN05444851_0580 [Aliiroseovarius sediminilitoris]|uniref:Uncharacterized protein n=1 Tax=Aliiroseovarius sediminilitoris TaxID=1173584 RepID=A0A1I0N6H3_9RHOB|nr:hypothetical protein [Aliiroseovarius sediminilitoris]SEV96503.1 hypothetical protein SAMN05444851_0580 [Aliiroseovarius sediminilitoris]